MQHDDSDDDNGNDDYGDDDDNEVSSPSTTEDELKPGMHKRKIAFAAKSASSLHSSSLRGLRNNWIITIIINIILVINLSTIIIILIFLIQANSQ